MIAAMRFFLNTIFALYPLMIGCNKTDELTSSPRYTRHQRASDAYLLNLIVLRNY